MSGRALVIDLLSHMRSEEAALMFEAAGLTTTRVFGTDQLTNACGYLAAMWAVMVHSLGTAFSSLTLDMARQANTLNMIELMNNNLGFHELGTAAWGSPTTRSCHSSRRTTRTATARRRAGSRGPARTTCSSGTLSAPAARPILPACTSTPSTQSRRRR